jgi:hypothetical protein
MNQDLAFLANLANRETIYGWSFFFGFNNDGKIYAQARNADGDIIKWIGSHAEWHEARQREEAR